MPRLGEWRLLTSQSDDNESGLRRAVERIERIEAMLTSMDKRLVDAEETGSRVGVLEDTVYSMGNDIYEMRMSMGDDIDKMRMYLESLRQRASDE